MPWLMRYLRDGGSALLAVALCAAPAAAADMVWQAPVEVAAGGGHKGPWRMNRSAFLYVDDPTVAINADGVIAVAWADNAAQDIFLQVYDPDGAARYATPVRASRSGQVFSWLPRLVIGPGVTPEIFVLWQEIIFSGGSHGGEVLFARSRDGGASFEAPVNLSNSTPGDGKGRLTARYWDNGSLDLVAAPEGTLFATWTEYDGRLWFTRSHDRGGSFSAPLLVGGDDARPARGPSLAAGGGGRVHLAWTVGEDRAADIHFASSADHGRSFSPPQVVFASDGHADAP